MNQELLELWKIIQESNLLTFVLFLGALALIFKKSVPKLVESQNLEIAKKLNEAENKRKEAEDKLAQAMKSLSDFEHNFESMREENEAMISKVKENLEKESDRELESLKQRYKKEIESIKDSAKREVREHAVKLAFELATEMLKSGKHKDFDLQSIDELAKHKI